MKLSTIIATALFVFSSTAMAFEPLSETEMAGVTGGEMINFPSGQVDNIAIELENYGEDETLEDLIKDSFDTLADATGVSFDFVIEGVQYGDRAVSTLNPVTQSLTLAGPESIDLIALRNLRVGANGLSMGSISIHDVQFHTMNLTITPRQ